MFRHKKAPVVIVIIAVIVCMAIVLVYNQCADAYWDDQASDNPSLILSGAGQNGNNIFALSYLQPIPTGWVGLYGARQATDGVVTSEVYAGHIQGGFDIGRLGLEAYVTMKRDLWQAIKLGVEAGYFGRPPGFTYKGVTFSSGFGNFSARNDNDTDIGRDAADKSTTFGWLAFVTGRLKTKYGEASGTTRYKPSLDLKDTRLELLAALNKEISDTWAFGVSSLTEFNSASIVDSHIHTSYLFSFTFTPED